jgi:hypothetical protein
MVETETGDYQFVIEVKTGEDTLNKTQLVKYCNHFGIDPQNTHTIQWSQVHEWFQSFQSQVKDELSSYLLAEFSEYLICQNLDRKVAIRRHSGVEKSVSLEKGTQNPKIGFHAKESGGSDTKTLTSEQYIDLFTEFFNELELSKEDRRKIFIGANEAKFRQAVSNFTGEEIASTDIGFKKQARYRLIASDLDGDENLLKLQEMREDGRSAEFPNTYHVMFTEWELLEAVFPDHGPGFTDATRNALFVNLQPDNSL